MARAHRLHRARGRCGVRAAAGERPLPPRDAHGAQRTRRQEVCATLAVVSATPRLIHRARAVVGWQVLRFAQMLVVLSSNANGPTGVSSATADELKTRFPNMFSVLIDVVFEPGSHWHRVRRRRRRRLHRSRSRRVQEDDGSASSRTAAAAAAAAVAVPPPAFNSCCWLAAS
eukprot:scaffold1768_cov194-Prasinococcus_capsulatus_cf.AAC.2